MEKNLPRLIVSLFALALVSCATGGGGAASTAGPAPTSSTKIYRLKIGRVSSVPLSNAEADRILAGATRVLRDQDSSSDASANVVLQRSGDVRVISGPAVISSPEDYAAIGRSGVQVALVEEVGFCTASKPGIIGCAHIGGSFMALVRRSSLEDIIWAHEFGHNCGLNHRNDSSALMYVEAGPNRRSLTAAEARTYETRRAASGSAALVEGSVPADAGEYLNRVYFHGIPLAHVARFGAAEAEKFKAVLADPARKAQWLNASVALGAIGTPDAVESVHRFVTEGRGRLDHDAYQARLGAVLGLGYGAARARTHHALEALARGSSIEHWKAQLHWSAPGRAAGEDTAQMLAGASFAGLALSRQSEAAALLEKAVRENAPGSRLHEQARAALQKF